MKPIGISFVIIAMGITLLGCASAALVFSHPNTVVRSNAGGGALMGFALILVGGAIHVL